MLTAHLPSGYCLGRLSGWRGRVLAAGMIGAVLPDIDLLFFYVIDDRAIHHHLYWVHIPAFWLVAASLVLPCVWRTTWRPVALAFFAAITMHLVLDSISGGILWTAPFSDKLWTVVTVPSTQSHWILSFVLHWTFLLELLIWATAGLLFLRKRPHRTN